MTEVATGDILSEKDTEHLWMTSSGVTFANDWNLLIVNNKGTRAICEMCLKLIIKTQNNV